MGLMIYFGALWLAVAVLSGGGIFDDWLWAYVLPATWAAILPLLRN